MKDLEFLTTIQDVKALAKLVLGNDPKITGWEFLNKCCVEVNQYQLPHSFRWRLRMKVMYHGKPFIEDFILDDNFNGKITRHGPLESEYKTDLFKDDRDYRSFEVFMDHGLPVVKITWHFPDFPWEKSKDVYNYSSDPEHISDFGQDDWLKSGKSNHLYWAKIGQWIAVLGWKRLYLMPIGSTYFVWYAILVAN